MSISIGGFLLLLIIFRIVIKRFFIRKKIKNLKLQRNAIKNLILDLQKSYFKSRKISSLEYKVKIKKFNDMILDINRRIPLLKKDLVELKEIE